MVASLRAELVVLRRWPAMWALVLLTPVLTLIVGYVVPLLQLRTLTPGQYATVGTPDQILPTILPGQFVIVATNNFSFQGTAPFIVAGAIMAGGDWGRGTITTALLQGPGRIRSLAGQVSALIVAVAVSVVLVFAAAGAASVAVAVLQTGSVSPAQGHLPDAGLIARGVGVAVLISVAYGMLGLLLGTLFRSMSAAIAAALVWTVFIQGMLDLAALQAGGIVRALDHALPSASAVTLTSIFGSVGGGADSALYLPVRPNIALCVLGGYLAGSLLLTGWLIRRRDIVVGAATRPRRRRDRNTSSVGAPLHVARTDQNGPVGAVAASLRAELLVLRRWPSMWMFLLITPLYTLINNYLIQWLFYRTADSGVIADLSPDQILPTLVPGRFVASALNNFGSNYGFEGTVPFILVGALVAGSDWGTGTIKTAVTQGPRRAWTVLGQATAVAAAIMSSVALTFAVAATASSVISLLETGSLSPSIGAFPPPEAVARGVAAAALIGLTYGAVGLALGSLFRSAGGAIAAALLWTDVLQPTLNNLAELHIVTVVNNALPDGNVAILTHLFGQVDFGPSGSQNAAPTSAGFTTAAVVLGLYAVVFLVLPTVLIRRRDIA